MVIMLTYTTIQAPMTYLIHGHGLCFFLHQNRRCRNFFNLYSISGEELHILNDTKLYQVYNTKLKLFHRSLKSKFSEITSFRQMYHAYKAFRQYGKIPKSKCMPYFLNGWEFPKNLRALCSPVIGDSITFWKTKIGW